jgi:sugar-specific transcriptional regulator TrmB
MTQKEYLAKLGLSDNQIKLYLDLAAHPDASVVQISKRVIEPRSSIYLELERLIDLGYVISKKVGKTTLYKITDPKILALTLESEAAKIQFLTTNLTSFAASIKTLETAKEPPKTINIYKGASGVKQLLWNIILSRSSLVIGFSPGQLEHVTDRDFAEKWRAEFMRRGMHNRIIFNQPKPLKWSDVPNFLEENVEARTLDETKIKFDRLTLIYDDVLTVCSLKTDSDQYGIEIRDQLLINSYKQIFQFLWDHVAEKSKI